MNGAHAGPRASSRIFLHLVARGMGCACPAAAAVEADHPGLEVETWLSDDDALLREDPQTLPQVLFILQGDEREQDGVHVSLALTESPCTAASRPGSRACWPAGRERWGARGTCGGVRRIARPASPPAGRGDTTGGRKERRWR